MILLIDNYDSFSYNLYQLIGEIEPDIRVVRNDELTIEEIRALQPARIVLSPGPGRPEQAGNIIEVVKTLGQEIPILGVCLGHQAICMAFGGVITYAKALMHREAVVGEAQSGLPAVCRLPCASARRPVSFAHRADGCNPRVAGGDRRHG